MSKMGPVVTSYELLPAPGVRVERISGLSNNLALSLKATSVRVQAPIPGKGVVGIEVPNSVSQLVLLRQIIEGTWLERRKSPPAARSWKRRLRARYRRRPGGDAASADCRRDGIG